MKLKLLSSIIFILFSWIFFFHPSQAQDLCKVVGWATQNGGTTGGGSKSPTTVTSMSALNSAAGGTGAAVIYVQGTLSGRVKVGSNKTIFGMPGAKIVGGVDLSGSKNVIIRNLTIQGPGAKDVDGIDCFSINNSSTNVWVDHCDIYDGQDGNLDIANASNYISITWTKFRYTSASSDHMFSCLFGNSDSKTSDRGKIKVTMQYNWFADNVKERMPRVRFGQVHVANNLFSSSTASTCVRAGKEADLLVENNAFVGRGTAIDLYENDFKAVLGRNNLGASAITKGTAFTPPYSLTLTQAAQVEAMVRSGAGPTLTSPNCGGTTTNTPPTVSISSPSNNASFTAPASITINANASDANGTVSNVQFYNGTSLLGSDASAPYSFSWSNVAAGTYTLTARATDNAGAVTTSSAVTVVVNAATNTPPTVSITSPSNNISFTAPASIAINANASDANGTVSNVQFYNGTSLLGSDASAPYSFSWSNVAAGTYTLTARATDNAGAVATSSAITVVVNSSTNTPPTVSITSPSNNTSFTAPASIAINVNASDANGTISNVQFYNGTTLLGSDASAPYSYSWSNVAAGNYFITARATDNNGAMATSSAISITVNGGTNGQCGSGVNFDLIGYATLTGGTTGGQGGTTVTVSTGTALQAAINNKGTQPLTIMVNGTITPSNSTGLSKIDVKDVSDISIIGVGTSGEFNGIGIKVWRASNIIIQNVKVHHVLLGDKDCISIEGPSDHIWVDHCELYNEYQGVGKDDYDGLLDAKAESEYITFSWNYLHDSWKASLAGSSESDTYNRKITYHHNYFQNINSRLPLFRGGNGHVFNNYYKDIASTGINSRLGACVKIENNYFENVNNPYVTAYSDQDGYGDIVGNILVNSPFEYASDTRLLPSCSATIPYSYSNSLNCTDLIPSIVPQYAGIGKLGNNPPPVNQTPNVSITAPSNTASFTAPASITITASASDADGSIVKVEFFNGSTLLGSDASSPYSFVWNGVSSGTYSLTAKATDNSGAITTSSVVNIVVNQPVGNQAPVVSLTAPANNTTFTAPASMTISASASDADGSISNVQFFNGSTLLGSDASSPYSFVWNGVGAGTYTLTARATDNNGAIATSSLVTVTVDSAPLPGGTTIQAETACSYDGVLETKNSGFNGASYVNLDNEVGASLSWSVNSPAAQTAQLTFRYANSSSNNRNMALIVNGITQIASLDFLYTGSWTTWNTLTASIDLVAGVNSLQLVALMNEGAPNLDEFTFNLSSISSASCVATTNQAPVVSIASPGSNMSYTPPTSIVISANASDADGTISSVQFYNGTTLLGSDASSPYTYTWNNVSAGTYTLTAKATDDKGAVSTSSGVTVMVANPSVNQAPVVSITAPGNNASFIAPASIIITADASDTDGVIHNVQFYNGSSLLGSDASSPYSFTWSNVASGTYSITAKATDNSGAVTSSSALSITVNAVQNPSGDILGPDCGATNSVISLELNSGKRNGATNYSWWVNGSTQSVTPLAGSAYLVDVQTGMYFTGGQVCVGVNYNIAPYYATFCKNLDLCPMQSLNSDLAFAPNPAVGSISLSGSEDIQAYTLMNEYGEVVYSGAAISSGQTVSFGESLKAGLYILQIYYVSGRLETKRILKVD